MPEHDARRAAKPNRTAEVGPSTSDADLQELYGNSEVQRLIADRSATVAPDAQAALGNAEVLRQLTAHLPERGELGSVLPMNEQPRALRDTLGNLLTENEHVVPRGHLKVLTTDPVTGLADYGEEHYRRDDTVRIERETALNKTHANRGGPAADNAITKRLKKTVRAGGALNKNEMLLDAIDNAKRARDATGSSVSDAALVRGALGQDGNLFGLQRLSETGSKIGATADEVDRAVAALELGEFDAPQAVAAPEAQPERIGVPAPDGPRALPAGKRGIGSMLLGGLDLVDAAGSLFGSFMGGVQIGTGIDRMMNGEVGEGGLDVAEGSVNLALDIGVGAATKAGWLAGEVGLGASALSLAAGAAAAGSIGLAAETARAAVRGEQTPLDVADEFYGTHFGDIVGWIRGDYRDEQPEE